MLVFSTYSIVFFLLMQRLIVLEHGDSGNKKIYSALFHRCDKVNCKAMPKHCGHFVYCYTHECVSHISECMNDKNLPTTAVL